MALSRRRIPGILTYRPALRGAGGMRRRGRRGVNEEWGGAYAMPHSHVCCYLHVVFGTKRRRDHLAADVRERLYAYLGGIARRHRMRLLDAGGTEDHVHLIVSLPGTLSVAQAVKRLKGGSSKWLHEAAPSLGSFEWQEGYGAFSVSPSVLNKTRAYIARQGEHHRRRTFEAEYREFQRRHPVDDTGLGTG